MEYVLALLGPDRIIPKSELPKDYTNYDGDYAQYPLDTARIQARGADGGGKIGLGKEENAGMDLGWELRCTGAF